MEEEVKTEVENTEVEQPQEVSPITQEDNGLIKVDLSQLSKAEAKEADEPVEPLVEQPVETPVSEEVVQEESQSILQEITNEEVEEKVEEVQEQVEQAIATKEPGVDLPENIQKVVDFINDTGGSLKDYVNLKSKYKRFIKTKENPFFNALNVKFSYALTCHKAQGGQWPTVFIEKPYLKEGVDMDYLRWLYTAVTRAEKRLYLIGF